MKHNLYISSFKIFFFRYVLPYLLFIIIFLFIFNIFLEKYIISYSKGSGAYKVDRLLHSNNWNEIPILGSSRAEGSILPDSLGNNIFNYGLAGVQDNVWIYFLEKELAKKHKTPILINFDFDGLSYDNGSVEYWLSNSLNKEVRVFFDKWKLMYLFPTLKYFGAFDNYFVNFLQQHLMLTGTINNGALLENKVLLPEEFNLLVKQRNNADLIFKNDTLLYNRLFKILQNNSHRDIVFFIPPYHESYLKSIKNIDDILLFLNNLDNIPKVTVLNYSNYKFNQKEYFNTTHLNYHGAIKFTSILKKDLLNNHLLD